MLLLPLVLGLACLPAPAPATDTQTVDDTAADTAADTDADTDTDTDTGRDTAPVDRDGDGYPNGDGPRDDCDDAHADVNPGATETCNHVDDDCDTLIDEADPDIVGAEIIYRDADHDGYGADGTGALVCFNRAGVSLVAGDCDDTNKAVHPEATEIEGNGIDDNCDGTTS